MKKLNAISLFTMLLISSVYSTQAMAVGKGFYLQAGAGSASWDAEDDFHSWSFDSDTSHAGFGFVLDTAVAKDKLFNYRFQIGYEQFEDKPTGSSRKLKMDSLVIDQDFGFGLVRNDRIRFWLGPELRVSFSGGTPDGYSDFDVVLFGLGLGPVMGINVHTNSRLSLGFKVGYMAMTYTGVGDDTSSANNDVDYNVDEGYTFVNFSMLFR